MMCDYDRPVPDYSDDEYCSNGITKDLSPVCHFCGCRFKTEKMLDTHLSLCPVAGILL